MNIGFIEFSDKLIHDIASFLRMTEEEIRTTLHKKDALLAHSDTQVMHRAQKLIDRSRRAYEKIMQLRMELQKAEEAFERANSGLQRLANDDPGIAIWKTLLEMEKSGGVHRWIVDDVRRAQFFFDFYNVLLTHTPQEADQSDSKRLVG